MSKILVIAEKPSVGRDIARVLKCTRKKDGSIEGDKYIVTWALGHLVTLADPDKYDPKYAKWNLEDLPMLPSKLKLEVISKTSRQYSFVKKLLHRNDVKEIVIATDAGREGELVARWIIEKASVKKPIKRLWISSVTDKAIRDGFNNLKNGKAYENLYHSAVARAEADWIVGLNATRALTCKHNAQLSCGRVQTPTVAIIAIREDEIRKFQPKEYYGITAKSEGLNLVWQNKKTGDKRTFDKEQCATIYNSIKNKNAKVTRIDKKVKKKYAPGLYNLTDLQQDANRLFDFSAKETLSIMQRLYEHYKILTYPRTDSKYISSDIVGTLKERLRACGNGSFAKPAAKLLKTNIKANKSFVDDSKVTDHHAIIPTEQTVFINELTFRERNIYDLVVKRFLGVMYPPYEYEQMTVETRIGDEIFTAKGNKPIKLGWKEVHTDRYEGEEDTEGSITIDIKQGSPLTVNKITMTNGKTAPPAYFNEGTLLAAMENPKKYMSGESKDLLKTISETGGLGTVATRADIIEKLFNNFLLEKKGKDIIVTSKGRQLLELVPSELKSPALTAEWEQKLGDIANGKLDKNKFIGDMRKYAKEIIVEIKSSDKKYKHTNLTGTKCPECGKFMLEVKNKRGKMLVCQDRECGHRKSLSRTTNARCPNCHKKLEMRGEGDAQTFVCKCGHKEKLSAFNKRKKAEGNKMSKKEVQNYLKKQKEENEAPLNTALAEALSKLKL